MSILKALARNRATVLLAATLLLLGAAGAYGARQLADVVARERRMDTAIAVCTALKSQQYETLAQMIDPAPVPQLAPGAFDQHALLAQLHTLDQQQGPVTSCTWRALQLNDDSATFFLSLRRQHATASIGMLVILERKPDIGWRISRRSPFTSKPV